MKMSRIKINTNSHQGMRALVAPNVVHGAIENADQGRRSKKLWRIDTLHGEKHLIIVSEQDVDFSSVAEQFGYGSNYECKEYDSFLNKIANGDQWKFKLIANPTIKLCHHDAIGNNKSVSLIYPEHQEKWLFDKAEKNGFTLPTNQMLIKQVEWCNFRKKQQSPHTVRFLAVTYEGVLTVTDSEKFVEALKYGIGREKAYGMGMLTITSLPALK